MTGLFNSDPEASQEPPHNTAKSPDSSAKPAKPQTKAFSPTPMMQQYLRIKEKHANCLLFYRMGDFYELFFNDAEQAAAALNIALTKRGKHRGEDIKMCGVPVHAADNYLSRLIKQGFRVAVCEQTESPELSKKRGAKAVVRRDVIRIITPGTLTEDNLLPPRQHNFLLSLVLLKSGGGAAWADISTGEFFVQEFSKSDMFALIERQAASEIIMPQSLYESDFSGEDNLKDKITVQADARFDTLNGEAKLRNHFGIAFGDSRQDLGAAETAAAGALLDYILLTQIESRWRINPPQRMQSADYLDIDAAGQRNLELARTLNGDYKGSLLHAIDRCVTAGGARLLAQRLKTPLTDIAAINHRLDQIQWFTEKIELRNEFRTILKGLPDLQRILTRIFAARTSPRDLAALVTGLQPVAHIRGKILEHTNKAAKDEKIWTEVCRHLGQHDILCRNLQKALADELPQNAADGGFIRKNYNAALDNIRKKRDEGRRLILAQERQYRKQTGIENLKIKHNNILGYHIEVSAKNAVRLNQEFAAEFIHRQTMVNAVRYTTKTLSDLARDINDAGDATLAMELEIFNELLQQVKNEAAAIRLTAQAFAILDCSLGLAHLADEWHYCRPQPDNSLDFHINNGRHPVVEQALQKNAAEFIANDCDLARSQNLWLLTGPNMAGKSTYLRQNALIAVLAQMGSFVPATQCRIGIIDKLFSRVGAADDLARGRSTFMVEMIETATILQRAGQRSLVILDEIGRGTATYDGLSIAWACLEYLHNTIRARVLFATHYHELTALEQQLPALVTRTMAVKEWQGEVVFLHHVRDGAADKSYGIHVAKLAGVPDTVTQRAEQLLQNLQTPQNNTPPQTHKPPEPHMPPHPVLERLQTLNIDTLTPRDALNLIYELQTIAETCENKKP